MIPYIKSPLIETVQKAMCPVRRWHEEYDHVLLLARLLIEAGWIQTPEEALSYFESPWDWTAEWNQYVHTGSVSDPTEITD